MRSVLTRSVRLRGGASGLRWPREETANSVAALPGNRRPSQSSRLNRHLAHAKYTKAMTPNTMITLSISGSRQWLLASAEAPSSLPYPTHRHLDS